MTARYGSIEFREHARRFPPPWSVEELEACFVVKDSAGQKLAYIYYEDAPAGKVFMTGGEDDYGDAFKEAKLEHDQRQQRSAAKQRLQAEVDADAAALSNVVLPQLQAASEKLEPLGGKLHCFVNALCKQPPSTARQGR